MRKSNKQIFEHFSSEHYLKSIEQVILPQNRLILEDILGFDEDTQGFLIVHKSHALAALPQEITACQFLKKLGMGVVLLDEKKASPTPDVMIGNRFFEVKRVSKSRNIQKAVLFQFRTAFRKADNLILHIDQTANPISLKNAIYVATCQYSKVRSVWLIFGGNLWQLDRKVILKNEFKLR